MKYRKKPIVIEAVRYLGRGGPTGRVTLLEGIKNDEGGYPRWLDEAMNKTGQEEGRVYADLGNLKIVTKEGVMICKPGDWIIRGVQGELYPCKADIFAETYQAQEEAADPADDTVDSRLGETLTSAFGDYAFGPEPGAAKTATEDGADLLREKRNAEFREEVREVLREIGIYARPAQYWPKTAGDEIDMQKAGPGPVVEMQELPLPTLSRVKTPAFLRAEHAVDQLQGLRSQVEKVLAAIDQIARGLSMRSHL